MKIRIKFAKHGTMKFIGHLDIMRYFQKAVRRAGIDIAYSGGFSPHQIMSFAAPLGVGLESNGEYLDIEVNSITDSKKLMEALNREMAEGIQVLSIRLLPDKAENAMASVAAAKYTVAYRETYTPDIDLVGQLSEFYGQPSIYITKKTKKSVKELDLKPFIYQLETDGFKVSMLVNASSSGNIKPGLVMEAFHIYCGLDSLPEFALCITREETYTNAGTQESVDLVPLDAVGEDF